MRNAPGRIIYCEHVLPIGDLLKNKRWSLAGGRHSGARLWLVAYPDFLFSLPVLLGWRLNVVPQSARPASCSGYHGSPVIMDRILSKTEAFAVVFYHSNWKLVDTAQEMISDQLMLMRRAQGKISKEVWIIAGREMQVVCFFPFTHSRSCPYSPWLELIVNLTWSGYT